LPGRIRDIQSIVAQSVSAWLAHDASSMGAALAFYTLFSVAPILIIALAVGAYGAAGSLIVLLLWIYYSAQIFLLGAEFTRVFAYAHGSHATHGALDAPAH
jgi:membrane protein